MSSEHDTWLRVAAQMSESSPDPSTQVGAVLLNPHGHCVATCFNDFPGLITTMGHYWQRREDKYARVIHPEMQCLMIAGTDETHGATMYCTHPPCPECAKHMVFARLGLLVLPKDAYRTEWAKRCWDAVALGSAILQEGEIEVIRHG